VSPQFKLWFVQISSKLALSCHNRFDMDRNWRESSKVTYLSNWKIKPPIFVHIEMRQVRVGFIAVRPAASRAMFPIIPASKTKKTLREVQIVQQATAVKRSKIKLESRHIAVCLSQLFGLINRRGSLWGSTFHSFSL